MTRIDFYVLNSASDGGKDTAVCRLAQKAFASGHRIYIRTPDNAAAQRLDALLWTFNQGSFIPHAIHPADPKEEFAVLIGNDEPPAEFSDILIQLAPEPPAAFDRFQRVLEVVGADEDDKQQGRNRFRFYRERGCTPTTHTL
jgi:DNA polymerase III subunit chi